jgi:hypothetical protein
MIMRDMKAELSREPSNVLGWVHDAWCALRQGLPCVGLNGTVVLLRHSEHVTCVSTRRRPVVPSLLALHCLQSFGAWVNPFS